MTKPAARYALVTVPGDQVNATAYRYVESAVRACDQLDGYGYVIDLVTGQVLHGNVYEEVRTYAGSGNWNIYHVPNGETLDCGKHYVRTEWRS